ncbi:MAG: hypothetical protein ACREJM_11825, partial [Candidatus Saccharimonadales bacterium]
IARTAATTAAAPAATSSTDFAAVIAEMRADREALICALTQRPEPPDPFQQFERFSTIMGNLRAAPVEASNRGTIETVRETLSLVKELAPSLGGAPERSAGIWDLLKSVIENPGVLDAVKAVTDNLRANRPQPGQTMLPAPAPAAAPAPAPPLPQPIPPPAVSNGGAPPDPQTLFKQLDTYVPFLATKAEANAEPALYAELLLDNLPPDLSRTLITTPGILDMLQQEYPAITAHREWFNRVLAEMQAQASEEGEGEADATDAAAGEARAHS